MSTKTFRHLQVPTVDLLSKAKWVELNTEKSYDLGFDNLPVALTLNTATRTICGSFSC